MFCRARACRGRLILIVAVSLCAAAEVSAQDVLTLGEALDLAATQQPSVQAPQAMARAARETAVAERQLPDPTLSLGLANVPVEGAQALDLRSEPMTQVMVEFSQPLPRASTRRLRSEQALLEADAADVLSLQVLSEVRRDAAVAWFEAMGREQAHALAVRNHAEALQLVQAVEIDHRGGRATQAQLLDARLAAAMAEDRVAALRLQAHHARTVLSRWIGEAAFRPLPQSWPVLPAPAPLANVLAHTAQHPRLEVLSVQIEAADKAVALARDSYRPNWSVDVYYANRPAYADMVGARVNIDLPLFAGNRQDRRLAASVARREEANARHADALNEQSAQVHRAWAEYEDSDARLSRFDESILPTARQRVAAVQAAYGAGTGSLVEVYASRRTVLDMQIEQTALTVARARALILIQYFSTAGVRHEYP